MSESEVEAPRTTDDDFSSKEEEEYSLSSTSSRREEQHNVRNKKKNEKPTRSPKKKKEEDDTEDQAPTTPRKFLPYKDATLEAVVFHLMVKELTMRSTRGRDFFCRVYEWRWRITRIISLPVVPRCPSIPSVLKGVLPQNSSWESLTLGDVLLGLPLVILFVMGLVHGFGSDHDLWKSGKVVKHSLAFTLLTATKGNNLLTFFFGIPFDRLLPFHASAAGLTILLGLLHARVAYRYGAFNGQPNLVVHTTSEYAVYGIGEEGPNFFKFAFETNTNKAGFFLLVFLLLLGCTSFHKGVLRRRCFEIWLCLHLTTAFMVCLYAFMHNITSLVFLTLWWLIDLIIRYAVLASNLYPHQIKIRDLPRLQEQEQEQEQDDDSPFWVELTFKKNRHFSFLAGQFVRICIPEVGSLMFHPLAIVSAPRDREVRLVCKAGTGGWTRSLGKLSTEMDHWETLPCFIEGPYGSLSVDLQNEERYQIVLLVSGGMGATHCHGVGKSLLSDHIHGRKLHKLRTVWAIPNRDYLEVLRPPQLTEEDDPYRPNHHPVEDPKEEEKWEVVERAGGAGLGSAIVQTDVYLTKDDATAGRMRNDSSAISYHSGRPDLEAVLEETKAEAIKQSLSAVAVIGCGPPSMMQDLRKACRKHSEQAVLDTCRTKNQHEGIVFDLHELSFDL